MKINTNKDSKHTPFLHANMSPIHMITQIKHRHSPVSVRSIRIHLDLCPAAKESNGRVKFKSTVEIQPIDCEMTLEEKSRSYYSKEELNTLHHEVNAIHNAFKHFPDESSPCGVHMTTAQGCMIGLEADTALRGLERYLCPARARNKFIARKGILKYQNNLNANTNKTRDEKKRSLARASVKLSHWSKLVARETARIDSLRACEGDYLIPISEPTVIAPFPFPKSKTTKVRKVVTFYGDCPVAKRRRGIVFN